jgi:hypothetical protein
MSEEKLKDIIKVQSEIIEILSIEYLKPHRSPYEEEQMKDLVKLLKNLQKELI